MKRTLFFLCVFLWPLIFVYAQQEIEVPVWSVGDTWIFTAQGIAQGRVEVISADESTYTVTFSHCMFDRTPSTVIFDRSTLERVHYLEGDKRKNYDWARRRLFNFPLSVGKQWGKDKCSGLPIYNPDAPQIVRDYSESYSVIGWEDVTVQAGQFRAIKFEYTQVVMYGARAGKAYFWFSPEVKYLVKCQIDKDYWKTGFDYELVSFELRR